MQIIHITQLIKKPLNKLERFFKKRVIIAFLYVFHVSRLFLSRGFFFRKRFSHVSIVIHVEICKKISVAITNGVFLYFDFHFQFNVYILRNLHYVPMWRLLQSSKVGYYFRKFLLSSFFSFIFIFQNSRVLFFQTKMRSNSISVKTG